MSHVPFEQVLDIFNRKTDESNYRLVNLKFNLPIVRVGGGDFQKGWDPSPPPPL